MNNPASNANETLTAAARSLRNVRMMPIGSKSQALRRALGGQERVLLLEPAAAHTRGRSLV